MLFHDGKDMFDPMLFHGSKDLFGLILFQRGKNLVNIMLFSSDKDLVLIYSMNHQKGLSWFHYKRMDLKDLGGMSLGFGSPLVSILIGVFFI